LSDEFVRNIQRNLNIMGFNAGAEDGLNGPSTRLAVARFQLAFNLGNPLAVDGLYGPMTLGAMSEVEKRGNISPNFSLNEVRSKGDRTAFVHRDLLKALDALWAHVGKPLGIVSGWRDVAHNRRVGGARTSQHTFGAAPELEAIRVRLAPGAHLGAGRAADFNRGYINLEDARALQLFSGLGWRQDGQQWVTHGDVRTNAQPFNPTVWRYG
jgi:hypothetical protein